MRLIILPEYDTATPHVLVDTVFTRAIPELGHTVHMVRPAPGLTHVAEQRAVHGAGRLITFPAEPPGSRLQFFARRRRHRRFVAQALQQLSAEPVDAIIVRNDLVGAAVAARFAAARRAPFVFQVSSPEAEFRINGQHSRFEFGRLLHVARGSMDLAARRRLCRRADAVLAISATMRRHLIERDGIPAGRVFAFPMGLGSNADPGAAAVEEARAELALPWGPTIAYSGVLDPIRQPAFMLDVLELVRRRVRNAGLLVITYQQDQRRRTFESDASARGLPVRVVGPIHHSKVSAYVRCADVMLCPVPPRFEFAMMSPTKSIEALGAGVAVVGSSEVEEHRRMLVQGGGGIAVPFRAESFADALVSLLINPGERQRMAVAGRRWALQFRTYARLTRYLESILVAVIEGDQLASGPHDPDEAEPDSVPEWTDALTSNTAAHCRR
jgi:glycosyltransferase involved in cell wall biosynthesis